MTASKSAVFGLDTTALERTERKFRIKAAAAKARAQELLGVFDEPLTEEELWAMKYLYAYMPINDMADYNGELFLSHVRRTLAIRRKMPWGARVPDGLFLHFVLPYRVNTENIEDSRGMLHDMLAPRTASLSMADAILETNYWCHEKATYIGSDLRTMSPLTMIRNARGRCGEESTLAVAALRSIGIPARQVYTPRWAHCDDNHAWVEAWADGNWYYFGACEPEARLNQGWFTPPARRAMLVNTRILADYSGPEDITLAAEWFTEINLLENYAQARTVTVRVKNAQGMPVVGADVYFELYNFAEFYPIASLKTNERGEAAFKSGYGDLVIRAVQGGQWGETKREGGAITTVIEIVIDSSEQPCDSRDIEIVPPPELEGVEAEPIDGKQMERHNRRLEEGSAIRAAYEATFLGETEARHLAQSKGFSEERVWNLLRKARGNSQEIAAFLSGSAASYGEWPLRLLESLNEKDLADTFTPTLDDHLFQSLAVRGELADELFVPYVLCPRVLHEMIVPYKRFFQEAFGGEQQVTYQADPQALASWLGEAFELWEDMPNLKGKGNPVGAYKLMKGDPITRAIVFVSACRSLGIPARLHPSELKPQFWQRGGWEDACFMGATFLEGASPSETAQGSGLLLFLRDPAADSSAPEASYMENFTFARLEKGIYKTLLYPHSTSDVYERPFEVEPGAYRLTTGVRHKDGSVLARWTYFTVQKGERTDVTLTFRQDAAAIPRLGTLNMAAKLTVPDGSGQTLGELVGIQCAIVAWIEPEREPTKHLLRELAELAEPLEELCMPVILIIGDREWVSSLTHSGFPGLPSRVRFVRDSTFEALPSVSEAGYPYLFVLDGGHAIRYRSSGYRIGAGKEALRILTLITANGAEGGKRDE
ncbi:transglutaminase-like putative cysteine protease [Paenibacillus phyllosphaerae]|uniref:Transglutaminase-like putative cysteine protease n=1 Tax=Paenibacillus phyllosphaerae TaxID=274593 RepID=A0A7W5B372_9BACL|nr:transglutaminase-like domain-containing protein [Paenibacillus phyllosphaerae]MBB3113387.1 transglutaminase-like putative cysteine protease [Paenibacillus phyllosphaerae]